MPDRAGGRAEVPVLPGSVAAAAVIISVPPGGKSTRVHMCRQALPPRRACDHKAACHIGRSRNRLLCVELNAP